MKLREFILVSVFYLLLTVLFFYKIFLNLIPLPTDIIVGGYYPWLSYKYTDAVGVPVKNPKLSDAVSIFYPLKALAAETIKSGHLPLWNPYMFGGAPLLINPTIGLLFPTSLFFVFLRSESAWTFQTMAQPFLGALFMYVLLRHMKLPSLSSIFGGIVYGFGGFSILWLEWNSQAATSLFLPILILFEDKYLLEKKAKWGVLLAIFFSFQIVAGYLPILPLTLICLTAWYLFFKTNVKDGLMLSFYLFLGICLSAFFLIPLGELIFISQRTSETLGGQIPFVLPKNLITLLVPDFFGNDATYNFWGEGDHMDATLYVGIATLVMSLVSSLKIRSVKQVRFALFLIVLALMLSLSNPISMFLYKLGLWGGSSITMNRVNFIHNFSFAILASFGISSIRKTPSKILLRSAGLIIVVLLGLLFGLFVYKNSAQISLSTITLTHINIVLRNLIWPTIMALGIFLGVLIFKKIRNYIFVLEILLILILVIDLFRLGWKFNTFSISKYLYPSTPISDYLIEYPNERFAAEKDIFPANMWVSYKLSTIAGYDSIYPLRTAKLIAVANSGDVDSTPQTRWGMLESFSSKLTDLFNIRFVIALKKDINGKVDTTGKISDVYKDDKYSTVFEDKGLVILENKNRLPRTYITKQVIKMSDEETLKSLIDSNFPVSTVAITEDFELTAKSSEPLVYTTDYNQISNNRVVVHTSTNQDAFLVVLDSYYPGWKVYVDNKQSTIYRTNYNFRGVPLSPGKHEVQFIYYPLSLKVGLVISGLTILWLFVILKKCSSKTN